MPNTMIPLLVKCCGEGCGKVLETRWVNYNGLGDDSKYRYIKDGELVSHGMCEACQLSYYGEILARRKSNE